MTTPELFLPPWDDAGDRQACTLDITKELQHMEKNSIGEFSLCVESLINKGQSLSPRQRYLIVKHGSDYGKSPGEHTGKYDELEERLSRHIGEFILGYKPETGLLVVARLANPHPLYIAGLNPRTYHMWTEMKLTVSSSTFNTVDEDGMVGPTASRDFIERGEWDIPLSQSERDYNFLPGGAGLNPEQPCYSKVTEHELFIGVDEIQSWQRNNLALAQHVQNMMDAWGTKGINVPVARSMPWSNAADLFERDGISVPGYRE